MRILDRYVWKELVTPFCLGLLVFTFLLLIDRIFDLTDLIINKGVPVHLVLMMLVYISPAILVLTIPIGFLLAILVAFGRLSADMEVVALKACGVSPLRLLWPVVVFGVGVTAMTAYLMIDAVPKSNYAFKSLVFEIVRTQATVGLKERVFNDTFGNFVIYVDEIATDQVALRNVFVSDERKPEEQRFITAREGRLLSDEVNRRVTLRLLDGAIHETSPNALQKYREVRFRLYDITLVLENPLLKQGGTPKGDREMSLAELRKATQKAINLKGNPNPVPGRDPQEVRDPDGVPRLQRPGRAPGHPCPPGRPLGRLRRALAHRALLLRRADSRREHRRLRADPALARDVDAEPDRGRPRPLPAAGEPEGAPGSPGRAAPAGILGRRRVDPGRLAARRVGGEAAPWGRQCRAPQSRARAAGAPDERLQHRRPVPERGVPDAVCLRHRARERRGDRGRPDDHAGAVHSPQARPRASSCCTSSTGRRPSCTRGSTS